MEIQLKPIGFVHSCFKEKFGIPRQPGLAPSATAVIRLTETEDMRRAVRDLESFSHIWVIFFFHQAFADTQPWNPCVRPPRLGGNRKVGVLASRSPHRPNPIGLSAVRLLGVDAQAKTGPEIRIAGIDLLDGTPVLDIKPYLPYSDSIPDAKAAWAQGTLPQLPVRFSPEAELILRQETRYPEFRELIRETLSLDPRPAFQAKHSRKSRQDVSNDYAIRLLDFDVHWKLIENPDRPERPECEVYEIRPLRTPASIRANGSPASSKKPSRRSPG